VCVCVRVACARRGARPVDGRERERGEGRGVEESCVQACVGGRATQNRVDPSVRPASPARTQARQVRDLGECERGRRRGSKRERCTNREGRHQAAKRTFFLRVRAREGSSCPHSPVSVLCVCVARARVHPGGCTSVAVRHTHRPVGLQSAPPGCRAAREGGERGAEVQGGAEEGGRARIRPRPPPPTPLPTPGAASNCARTRPPERRGCRPRCVTEN